jgi:hypothetical protein
MLAPRWEDLFKELEGLELKTRSYPYQYGDLTMMKVYVYSRIKGINGFKTIHRHLQLRPDVLKLIGLEKIPHRKTLAERFRGICAEVLDLLHQLTQRFMALGVVDPSIASVDSTLMQANGNIWHKKQMDAGELPKCGNVDSQAHWGVNGCGEWTFGYRLHCLTLCGVEGITWPATISLHSANIKDAKVFEDELSLQLPPTTEIVLGDGGYAQQACFAICDQNQTSLITPIQVKKTPHPNETNEPACIKTPIPARSLLYARPPLSPFKGNSRSVLLWSACPSRV